MSPARSSDEPGHPITRCDSRDAVLDGAMVDGDEARCTSTERPTGRNEELNPVGCDNVVPPGGAHARSL